jgi:hypothetical protein
MKKVTFIIMVILLLLPNGYVRNAYATMPVACNAPSAPSYPEYYVECVDGSGGSGSTIPNISANFFYVPFKDQYRMDYGSVPGATNYTLHFVAANSTVYNANYAFPPTGTHYLTCNGIYNLFFYDATGLMVGSTSAYTTTDIIAPTCNSYADGANGFNTLSGSMTNGVISWTADPSATKYEIYKQGAKIDETTGTTYTPTSDGSYSVVAKDATGAIVGQTDINVTTAPATCDACTNLSQLLACPDWGTYMGQLTNAISAAIPPPPDWDMVANKIGDSVINKLSDYIGNVPTVPTVAQIKNNVDTSLPTLDNSSTTAQTLVPTATEFNTPQAFDLSDAPVIPIVDDSRPFIISEPLSNITFDSPNVPVFPNDATNDSGGIIQPTTITGGMPTPSVNTGSVDDPIPTPNGSTTAPDDPIPTPQLDSGGYGGAIPDSTTGDIPIPSIIP